MFIHAALFEIMPKEVAKYRKDSLMWAGCTKKAKGFIKYYTIKRFDYKNQYASVYVWKTKKDHDSFMKKYHESLVSKSQAQVSVLGYHSFKTVDEVKNARNCE